MQTSNYQKHITRNPISRFFLQNFYTVFSSEVRKLKPVSILDAGCGEGFTLARLKLDKIGKRLEGIEYSSKAITLGKKLHPNVTIKKGDIYNLPYKDNSFDLVLSAEVLEHLENPDEALDELKRVSKKYVILSVPDEPLFTIQRFLRGRNIKKLGWHPEHIQHWSARSFKIFVEKKLQIVTLKTPLPWILVVAKKR